MVHSLLGACNNLLYLVFEMSVMQGAPTVLLSKARENEKKRETTATKPPPREGFWGELR